MSDLVLRGSPHDEIALLEAEIASQRERVAISLGDVHRGVNDVLSWRHWARAHPLAWICAGVCLGFVVGYRGRPRG